LDTDLQVPDCVLCGRASMRRVKGGFVPAYALSDDARSRNSARGLNPGNVLPHPLRFGDLLGHAAVKALPVTTVGHHEESDAPEPLIMKRYTRGRPQAAVG
jgi:hypothetical protein